MMLDREAKASNGPEDCGRIHQHPAMCQCNKNHCAPGRLLKFGVADGYALYIITRVNKKTCKVVHIPYMDGYRSPAVNQDSEVWRDEAEDNIAWYDTLMEMAERVKQNPNQPEPALPVVVAE